jgi:hypothetical protein
MDNDSQPIKMAANQFIAERHADADREEAEYQEWKAPRRCCRRFTIPQ